MTNSAAMKELVANLQAVTAWSEIGYLVAEERISLYGYSLHQDPKYLEEYHDFQQRVQDVLARESVGAAGSDHERVVRARVEQGYRVSPQRPPILLRRCRVMLLPISACDARDQLTEAVEALVSHWEKQSQDLYDRALLTSAAGYRLIVFRLDSSQCLWVQL